MKRISSKLIMGLLICLFVPGSYGQTDVKKDASDPTINLLVISFDPLVDKEKRTKLHQTLREITTRMGYDPAWMTSTLIDDMKESTGGRVCFVVKEWIELDEMPKANNNFQYEVTDYVNDLRSAVAWARNYWDWSGWKNKDGWSFDYEYYIKRFNLVERVNSGEIRQVWFFMPPLCGAGAYESQMAGKNAYWCNSPPIVRNDVKPFIMFNFNYEREVGCALEDFGHAMESIMTKVYGRWEDTIQMAAKNTWEKFTLYDKIAPGKANCGNVHFAPNSDADYDWGNKRNVPSNYAEWMIYPGSKGEDIRMVNNETWGGGDMRLHHLWWFRCIPKADGISSDGICYNWWKYFADPELAIR